MRWQDIAGEELLIDTSWDLRQVGAPEDPENAAPLVDGGQDSTITLGEDAQLNGSVSDDDNPDPPGVLTLEWSVESGTGGVTFDDASAEDTSASFVEAGSYVLALEADGGELAASDQVTVVVEAPPPPAPSLPSRTVAKAATRAPGPRRRASADRPCQRSWHSGKPWLLSGFSWLLVASRGEAASCVSAGPATMLESTLALW